MPLQSPDPKRVTKLPRSNDAPRGPTKPRLNALKNKSEDSKRRTRFPGAPNQQTEPAKSLNVTTAEAQGERNLTAITSTSGSDIDSLFVGSTEQVQPILALSIRHENPWLTYSPLRSVAQRSQIRVACTRSVPIRIVTVNDASRAIRLQSIIKFQHRNLVEFIEAYTYEGRMIVVSEYMQVSLSQAIAIPYEFEEVHISAVCSQVCQPR